MKDVRFKKLMVVLSLGAFTLISVQGAQAFADRGDDPRRGGEARGGRGGGGPDRGGDHGPGRGGPRGDHGPGRPGPGPGPVRPGPGPVRPGPGPGPVRPGPGPGPVRPGPGPVRPGPGPVRPGPGPVRPGPGPVRPGPGPVRPGPGPVRPGPGPVRPGPGPVRPGPGPVRPGPGPVRPGPGPVEPGRPSRGDHWGRDRHEGRGSDAESMRRRREIDVRRAAVRADRERRRSDIIRNRERVRWDRDDWHRRHPVHVVRDIGRIRSISTWDDRYARWYDDCVRPAPIYVRNPIRWPEPMPSAGYWDLATIETVATNLEGLSRDVLVTMSDAVIDNPNREYAERLPRVLAQLVDAAENYTDAVYQGDDFTDSLNDLFYLESQVDLAERTLDGYSKAYYVESEMQSIRYYVDELLWTYRQNY